MTVKAKEKRGEGGFSIGTVETRINKEAHNLVSLQRYQLSFKRGQEVCTAEQS